ncbi:MAG: creatininase family protein [Anaerolineaceae bacterium]|nr:creatininase family protein [Anaerolineaceae bacterium]
MAAEFVPTASECLHPQSAQEELSRRQFLSILAASGGALMLAACGANPAGSAHPLFEGYSVFQETMVAMSWVAIKEAAQAGAIVLLPVGVIEEHGPHMGLAPDIYQTYNWAKMTRRALEAKGIRTLIAPPMYWGISLQVRNYPGTFTIRPATMKSLLFDIHASLNEWGFKYVFNFSAHGDSLHNQVFEEAVKEAHDKLQIEAFFVVPNGTKVTEESRAVFLKKMATSEVIQKHLDFHSGAFETAKMVAYFPKDVDQQAAKSLKPTTEFAPFGYWGDPASFDQIPSSEIRAMAEEIVAATVEAIEPVIQRK